MSYCHVAPVRYEAVALRVGVHLAYRRAERGENPKKGERKGSTGVPFEHRFGCDVAGMEVTMFFVLAGLGTGRLMCLMAADVLHR